jgi:transposase-like protein
MEIQAELKNYQEKIIERLIGQFSVLNETDVSKFTPLGTMVCVKCGGDFFVKNGTHNDRQRYKCKKCKNTQFADANTALYNLKLKDKWVDFVFIMLDKDQPKTLKKIGELLDINIKTAHQWRHKFLTAISEVQQLEVSQEVELDEIYLPFCVKGRIGKEKYDMWYKEHDPRNIESELRKEEKIKESEHYQTILLCSHNRNNDFDFHPIKIQKKGIVSQEDLKRTCNLDLKKKTVITDSEPSMKAFLNSIEGVEHKTFKSSDMKQGKMVEANIHNNNINNTMTRLRKWLGLFNGISTKYINLYLKWFRFENLFSFSEIKKNVKTSLTDKMTYSNYRNIFSNYTQLMEI